MNHRQVRRKKLSIHQPKTPQIMLHEEVHIVEIITQKGLKTQHENKSEPDRVHRNDNHI